MLTRKDYLLMLEKICRSSILSFLHGCGLHVIGEMHTNKGRSDLVFSSDLMPVDNLTFYSTFGVASSLRRHTT